MADEPKKGLDAATGTPFKGHEWDGIRELDTPLPRWWLWTFYATILFAIGYTIAYPAWPMIDSATRGMLGWSSRGALASELAARDAQLAPVHQAIAATTIAKLAGRPELMRVAVEGGRAAFMGRGPPDRRAIPISTMTTGCGAAISPPSRRRSPMASATPTMPTRASR